MKDSIPSALVFSLDSEALFSRTLEASLSGLYVYDLAAGVNVFINRRYTELTGHRLDDIAAMDTAAFARLFHPEDAAGVVAHMQTMAQAADGEQHEIEYRFRTADERWIWCRSRDTVFSRSENGEVHRFVGTFLDITEQKRAESELAQSNALLDALFEQAPIGLAVVDRDLRFVRINQRLADMNGLPRQAHIGKRPDELLPDIQDLPAVLERLRDILRTGEPWLDVEISGATPAAPGEMKFWREHFFPIRVGSDIFGIGAVAEETTARKKAETDLLYLLQEVNHRAKNLMTVVQSIARSTARDCSPEEFLQEFDGRLLGLAESQNLIIRGDWRVVGLADLIQSQLCHLGETVSARVLLSGDEVSITPAAAQGIGMAMHELVTNALKYGALSNDTGNVEVTWRRIAGGEERTFCLEWIESGGPAVKRPHRRGFGRTVIEDLVSQAVGGSVELNFARDGVRWTLTAPEAGLISPPSGGPHHRA